jgi:6,7-dimethyl-8-ribityllumazine synthase
MSTTNLSSYKKDQLPDASTMRIGIVVSEWNADITENLYRGAVETLTDCGLRLDNIHVVNVPGSYELPMGAQMLLHNRSLEAVICLGSVIRGETPHFDFVCHAVAAGIKDVGLKMNKPVIFGVLTDNSIEQSRARSGGALGNKGVEAAVTAIKMVGLKRQLEDSWT